MNISDTSVDFLSAVFSSSVKTSDELLHTVLRKLVALSGNRHGIVLGDCFEHSDCRVLDRYNMQADSDGPFIDEVKRLITSGFISKDMTVKSPVLISNRVIPLPGLNNKVAGMSGKYLMIKAGKSRENTYILFSYGRTDDYTTEEFKEYQFISDLSFGIYEMKIRNERLGKTLERAVESERLKNMIMLNISHEIRTPLNAIVGFSNLLSENDLPGDSKEKYIDIILKSSEELLSIIADVTEISSLEANLQRTNISDTDVDSLLKETIEKFSKEAGRKGITVNYQSELQGGNTIFGTDRYKLEYIIKSLITNAFKFTYSGKVSLRTFISGNMIHFTVSDTGRGIPPEYHDKIFDYLSPFENILAKKAEGPEIGIAISYTYVKHLGGEMWFNSKEGEGTVFSFTLPFFKTDHHSPGSGLTKDESTTARGEKVILVAEDDDNNYSLIEHILRKENVKLLRAVNGKKAVDMCKSAEIDLVLMDIKMPEMDGYMATKLIKEIKPDQKIIAQTAYISDREYAISCGCIDFIAKPFGKQQLLSVVNNYI
ncbi:MAG TPA: response regulator [Bacteroidales bacterium]|nr:response regulator [Bacteroidales bacterium]